MHKINPSIVKALCSEIGTVEGKRTVFLAETALSAGMRVHKEETNYVISLNGVDLAEADLDSMDLTMGLADALENVRSMVAFSPSMVCGSENVGTLKGARKTHPDLFNQIMAGVDRALNSLN